jgi:hypothetical protein
MRGSQLAVSLAALLALLNASCSDSVSSSSLANDRIAIENDASALSARVTYFNDSIPLDSTSIGYPSAPLWPSAVAPTSAASQANYNLNLKAEVAPPSINGQPLQATSVALVGNLAVVSYNMVGNPYLGAIDVIDVTNKNYPVLTSQALFQNTDMSAVSVSGANVYAAEATGDAGFASPAVFEVMTLSGNQLMLNGNRRMGLSSFVGTSTAASATRAYATSGDNGALFVINPATFTVLNTIPLHDARWVALGGGKIVVVQGTPGQISVFDESTLASVGTWSFTGADIAESKSTVAVVGGKAFIAAGSGGVKVLSASTGAVVGSVPRPNPDSLGLSPSVVVTNAVAVDQNVLFISNGEAGVYLADAAQNFAATGSETAQAITMRGKLRFGNLQSVNHVAYSGGGPGNPGLLIVAAGLGGLKIVQVN